MPPPIYQNEMWGLLVWRKNIVYQNNNVHYNVHVSAGIKSKIAIQTLIPPINPQPYLMYLLNEDKIG